METKELSPKSDKYSVKQHDTLQLINTSNWVLGNIPLWEAAGEEETKKFRQEIKVWVKSGANMFWKEITKIWCAFWMCFPGKEQGTAQTTGGGTLEWCWQHIKQATVESHVSRLFCSWLDGTLLRNIHPSHQKIHLVLKAHVTSGGLGWQRSICLGCQCQGDWNNNAVTKVQWK